MGHVGQSCEAAWSPSAIRTPSTQERTCLDLSWGLGDTSGEQSRPSSHGARANAKLASAPSLSPTSPPSAGGPGTKSSNWTKAATQACNEEWTLWKLPDGRIIKDKLFVKRTYIHKLYMNNFYIVLVMFLSFLQWRLSSWLILYVTKSLVTFWYCCHNRHLYRCKTL